MDPAYGWIGIYTSAGVVLVSAYLVWRAVRDTIELRGSHGGAGRRAGETRGRSGGTDLGPGAPGPEPWTKGEEAGWSPEEDEPWRPDPSDSWRPDEGWTPGADDGWTPEDEDGWHPDDDGWSPDRGGESGGLPRG